MAEIDLRTITQFSLSFEEQGYFDKGIRLFNAEKFWEAHEAWEEIWKNHPEDGRFFIQGLIQLAAGYHQLKRGIYRGFVIHLKQAEERLSLFPQLFLGVNVASLLIAIRTSLRKMGLESPSSSPDPSGMEIPRIELTHGG